MTLSLDHPVRSFLQNCSKWFSCWQFDIKWCLLEQKGKKKGIFFTQNPCKMLWNIVCILFLVAASSQQLGTCLISSPELRNNSRLLNSHCEQVTALQVSTAHPGVLNPGSAPSNPSLCSRVMG